MAVMEAKDLKHGPVEAVITADEETGMYGANDLPENELNGDILLNLILRNGANSSSVVLVVSTLPPNWIIKK